MNYIKWRIIAALAVGLVLVVLSQYLFSKSLYFSCLVSVMGLLIAGYLLYQSIYMVLFKTDQTLRAIAKEDFSLKIGPKNLPESIHLSLNEILEIYKKRNLSNHSTKIIYESIIESTDSGILILRESEGELSMYYSNHAFSKLLEIPRYTHWHLLEKELQGFSQYLAPEKWGDVKDVITLSLNGKEQTCSIHTSVSTIYNSRYLIVNLDTIQSIIDRKEKEAWFNLMKVMSHEILNSITPISSLSENLEHLIGNSEKELGEDFEDVHRSVVTIKNRTRHLLDFVDTYRSLTDLRSPQKKSVNVSELIHQSVQVLSSMILEKGIEVRIEIPSDRSTLFVDETQMGQVIINLITNSIYALEQVENPLIEVSVVQEKDKMQLEIMDNGIGISPSIKREVFVPFFTTRSNGSGIGLSLSRNIVNAHGGQIRFISEPGETRFLISL